MLPPSPTLAPHSLALLPPSQYESGYETLLLMAYYAALNDTFCRNFMILHTIYGYVNPLSEIGLVILALVFLVYFVFSKRMIIYKVYLFFISILLFSFFCVFFEFQSAQYAIGAGCVSILGGLMCSSFVVSLTKAIILLLLFASIILIMSSWDYDLKVIFESLVIILLAVVGMLFLQSSSNFLLAFVSLELQSIGLYILAATKKNSKFATEAALKYFIFSAFSSALFALGCSLIYGIIGTTCFSEIAISSVFITSHTNNLYYYMLLLGSSLILISLLFKLGVAPFHLWVADVYEGVPSYLLAFYALVSKVATLGFFYTLYIHVFNAFSVEFSTIILYLSVLSIVIGSIGALKQTKIKRLVAYSSITHMGYILLPLSTYTVVGLYASWLYLLVYITLTLSLLILLTSVYQEDINTPQVKLKTTSNVSLFSKVNLKSISDYLVKNIKVRIHSLPSEVNFKSIFAYLVKNIKVRIIFENLLVYLLERKLFTKLFFHTTLGNIHLNQMAYKKIKLRKLNQLAGLFHEKPAIACVMAFNLFSLAGIPPLAGFFAKVYVLKTLIHFSWIFTSIIIVIVSVIASFYYIRLIKVMFFDVSSIQIANKVSSRFKFNNMSFLASILLVICTLINVFYCMFPTTWGIGGCHTQWQTYAAYALKLYCKLLPQDYHLLAPTKNHYTSTSTIINRIIYKDAHPPEFPY